MTRTHSSRRDLLRAAGVLAAGGALSTTVTGQGDGDGFAVVQSGRCAEVTPLVSAQPVEELYDYRLGDTRFSSNGTRNLQRNDTTITFLYRGPDDDLFLVVVHERLGGDSDGGAATFRISGLPGDGGWAVQDDNYTDANSTRYDRWAIGGSTDMVDWTWGAGRTDGGVFGPLGDDVSLTIRNAFNEAATLAGQFYDGTVERWQFLSGDVLDPDRYSLTLGETVEIRSGACPGDAGSLPEAPDRRFPGNETDGNDGGGAGGGGNESGDDAIPDVFGDNESDNGTDESG